MIMNPLLQKRKKQQRQMLQRQERPPPEVFDSSTYDSMTDLKTSASMEESEVNKVLSDTEGKEPIEPEAVHTESTTKNTNISPTVAPTMEGRAYTLKKSKESQTKQVSQIQSVVSIGKKKKR
ncbi:MAG: hypothetical protein ACJ71K_18170 [Nitrososphaeraceae archaeon]